MCRDLVRRDIRLKSVSSESMGMFSEAVHAAYLLYNTRNQPPTTQFLSSMRPQPLRTITSRSILQYLTNHCHARRLTPHVTLTSDSRTSGARPAAKNAWHGSFSTPAGSACTDRLRRRASSPTTAHTPARRPPTHTSPDSIRCARPPASAHNGRRYQSPQCEDSLKQVHGLHLLDP